MTGGGPRLTLCLLPQDFTILRFPPDIPPPGWALGGGVWSASNTPLELTLVVETARVPAGCGGERSDGWRCLAIDEVFDFSVPGILAGVLAPLAGAGVGIFATSTFSTDHVWVTAPDVARALSALTEAGHSVHEEVQS